MRLPFNGYYPISQYFGENLNSYYKADGLLGHQGIDFPMPMGTPIYSTVNGTVIAVSRDIQKGEGVAILSSDKFLYKDQECFLDTIYWHLKDKSILVNVGDRVLTGQLIGLSNNTGQSTGPHLHFSIIPMFTDGSRRSIEPMSNGYHACVNPMQFLDFPTYIFNKTLKFGMAGEDVKQLQIRLGGISCDGIFGKNTLDKVQKFQTAHNLTADGIVGINTNKALNLA